MRYLMLFVAWSLLGCGADAGLERTASPDALPGARPPERFGTLRNDGQDAPPLAGDGSLPRNARGPLSIASIAVVGPEAPAPGLELALGQVVDWLEQAAAVPVAQVDPDALTADPATLVVALGPSDWSAPVVPAAEVSSLPAQSYVLRMGSVQGMEVLAGAGPDDLGDQYAAYALLERLGFGFFHPEQTYVPDAVTWPSSLDETWTPGYAWRGMHLHTMHPIELMDSLLVPTDDHLYEVRRYIDWLVANRQNYFQFVLQDTIDFDAWIPHAQVILEYAHDRGLKVGIDTPFQFVQQNAWVLVPYQGPWEPQIEYRLSRVLEAPFDVINVELGSSEWMPASDTQTVDMLNWTAAHLAEVYGIELISKVHVSSDQTAPHYGDINYNFLPGVCDSGVGVLPHTVQFFDLYRPAPTYDNEDFSSIREFLLDEIGERRVLYYPETAYWVSFDIDVPLFLPEYVYSRWNDLHQLDGSGMDGQVTFSSGFEWNYWLHDWASAGFSYEPGTDWRDYLQHFTKIFGGASSDVQALLVDMIEEQSVDLLEDNLIAYLIGWDTADDLGNLVNIHAQPVRVLFPEIRAMNPDELEAFYGDVIGRLKTLEDTYAGFQSRIEALEPSVPAAAMPWYEELKRSIQVTALRTKHVRLLNEGTVYRRRAELEHNDSAEVQAQALFAEAQDYRRTAEGIVAEQEAGYRFPADRLARLRENPTAYEFGYLYTVSDLYYWRREEIQAIDNNVCPCLGNIVDQLSTLYGEGAPLAEWVASWPTLPQECLDQCIHPVDSIEEVETGTSPLALTKRPLPWL